jgi:putative ABC transport system permease protein
LINPRWRKVIRDIWDNKSRTILVILSIAIGVFAFGGLFIARVIGSVELNGQYLRTNSSHIQMRLAPFDDTFVRWMARQKHVLGAQGRITYDVKLIESGGRAHNITLIAYSDFEAIEIGQIYPQEGAWPPPKDAILLERSSVGLTDLEIGDAIRIEMIDGRLFKLNFAGTVHDLNVLPGSIQSQLFGYVSFRTLNSLGLPANFNQIELTIDADYLAGDPEAVLPKLNNIANDLQKELERNRVSVGSVSIRRADRHWAYDVMDGLAIILIIVGLGSLLLSGFLVVNTISGLLAQQKRQIGIMKVIGASRMQIITVYLVMVVFLGIIALIVAVPSGLALAWFLLDGIVAIFLNFDIENFYLPVDVFVLQVAVAIVSPMLAALVPILSGTQMTAAQAISDYSVQNRSGVFDVLLAQIRGLSRPFLISLRNTFRRKIRLFMTLITLTIAGALFMSIMNVQTALKVDVQDRLRLSEFDVQVFLDNLYNKTGLERRIEQLPGVLVAEGWARSAVQRIRADGSKSDTFTVYGLPPDSDFVNPLVEQGRWLEAVEDNAIVVTTEWLEDEADVQVGDYVTLRLNDDDEWLVVGVVVSADSAAYALYDDWTHFQKTTNKTPMILLRTVERDAVSQQAVAAELEAFLNLRDIGVARTVTRYELESDAFGGFDILISVLFGMAIIVAAVGGLGLAGTMSLNVLERTREIGVIRAVGASTNTVRQMFLAEGVLIGVLSAVVALPLSTPGSQMFGNILGQVLAGRPLPFTPTVEGPLIWFVIIFAISALASMMPAQRASQISVREALAYE